MSKLLLARVLVQFTELGAQINPNDLVEGEEGLIKSLEKSGSVDSTPAAVEYCKSLGKKAINVTGDENPRLAEHLAEEAAKKEATKTAKPKKQAGNDANTGDAEAEKAAEAKKLAMENAEAALAAANDALEAADDDGKGAAQQVVDNAQAALDALLAE